MNEYKPFRIIRTFAFAIVSIADMKARFPSAALENVPHRKSGAPLTGIYREGQVIDVPTPDEKMIFESLPFAMAIPQHPDGFDDPRSGIARSRKGSFEGRQRWIRYQAIQAEREKAARPKPEQPAARVPKRKLRPDTGESRPVEDKSEEKDGEKVE